MPHLSLVKTSSGNGKVAAWLVPASLMAMARRVTETPRAMRKIVATMVELAWLWLQNQPASALSLWFHERVRRLGGRMRKTTIVALARKLLIALWRYTTAGGRWQLLRHWQRQ